jgi:biotin-dependent carboxylase-like uncharacterized protein
MSALPYATIQDLGRFGYRDLGVPVSGVADRDSGIALNALLGNDRNAAMIELAVAGGTLRFDVAATIAIGGADAACTIGGQVVQPWKAIGVAAGDELKVERITGGRFLLIAVRGGIDVPMVLKSRSTLLSAAIGGFGGRRLRKGDSIAIDNMTIADLSAPPSRPRVESGAAIHVRRGPQAALFDDGAWSAFIGSDFTVSNASDRTGYRMEGAAIANSGAAALPSEPACVGAIQIPNGGSPIVIMNDGPTVGGYPKIAVIRSAFMSRFAQRVPGDKVRFVLDD